MEVDNFKQKSVWRKLGFILAIFFIYISPQFIIPMLIYLNLGKNPVAVAFLSAFILLTATLVYKMSQNRGLISKPFNFKFLTWKNILCIIGGYFAILGVTIIVGLLTATETTANQTAAESLFLYISPIPLFCMIVVAAPICEELIFRGAVKEWLDGPSKFHHIVALIVPSILFGLIHGPTDLGSFLLYVGMGFVLGAVAMLSNRIEVSMILHVVNNALGFIVIMLQ